MSAETIGLIIKHHPEIPNQYCRRENVVWLLQGSSG
jgi:hypothetical protein